MDYEFKLYNMLSQMGRTNIAAEIFNNILRRHH